MLWDSLELEGWKFDCFPLYGSGLVGGLTKFALPFCFTIRELLFIGPVWLFYWQSEVHGCVVWSGSCICSCGCIMRVFSSRQLKFVLFASKLILCFCCFLCIVTINVSILRLPLALWFSGRRVQYLMCELHKSLVFKLRLI